MPRFATSVRPSGPTRPPSASEDMSRSSGGRRPCPVDLLRNHRQPHSRHLGHPHSDERRQARAALDCALAKPIAGGGESGNGEGPQGRGILPRRRSRQPELRPDSRSTATPAQPGRPTPTSIPNHFRSSKTASDSSCSFPSRPRSVRSPSTWTASAPWCRSEPPQVRRPRSSSTPLNSVRPPRCSPATTSYP